MVSLEKKDLSVKGWNWGIAHFTGNALEFDVDNKIGFEVPSATSLTQLPPNRK